MNTRNNFTHIILILFFTLTLFSCGGGNGGNGGNGDFGSGDADTDTPGAVEIETIPNARIEFTFNITSNDDYLYFGTENGIVELSKSTWMKRTLFGNTLHVSSDRYESKSFPYPWGLHLVGGHIYSGNENMVRTNITPDTLGAVEILLPDFMVEGCCNFDGITGNSTTLFYYQSSGTDSSDIYRINLEEVGPSTFVDTFPGTITAVANDKYLFILHNGSSGRDLTRLNLDTGEKTIIETSIPTVFHPEPLAVNSSHVFWFNNDSILKADIETGVIEYVNNINARIPNAYKLVADAEHVYALHKIDLFTAPNNGARVSRIDISTGALTQLTPDMHMRDIALHQGVLYGIATNTGHQIYSLDTAMAPELLFNSTGKDYPHSSTSVSSRIVGSGNYLFAGNGGSTIIKLDISNGDYQFIIPRTRPSYLYANNQTVYIGHEYGVPGISKAPSSKNLRSPEILFEPSPGNYMHYIDSYVDNEIIYWTSWTGAYSNTYEISKMQLDGSNREILFSSTGKLGQIAVHNGLIYFTCENACGEPGWVLASMPIHGGTPTPELGLLLSPIFYYLDNHFYIVDTEDFHRMSLFAVDIDVKTVTELESDLYYGDIHLDASNSWIYISENQYGTIVPVRRLRRYQKNSWDKLGQAQTIIDGYDDEVYSFFPSSIHSDDKHLYYFDSGIKRVAE